jgi:plasmid stabilization system protein ParE
MNFTVELSNKAHRDARKIKRWIARRSHDGAKRWLGALDSAVDKLEIAADIYDLAPESDALDMDIRQIVFQTRRGNPYRALFTIRGTRVVVLAVRGKGQPYVTTEDF